MEQFNLKWFHNWNKTHSLEEHGTFSKFTNCLVHVYIPYEGAFEHLHIVTTRIQRKKEWSHHSIIVKNLNQNHSDSGFHFYTQYIPISFARGLVLVADLDLDKVWMVCIPCALWHTGGRGKLLEEINLDFQNLDQAYNQEAVPLSSNLHLSQVATDIKNEIDMKDCNFASKYTVSAYRASLFVNLPFTICIHYFLHTKFNYTVPARGARDHRLFSVYTSAVISDDNLQALEYQKGGMGWTPFASISNNIEFVAIQSQTRFAGNFLTKPYDWRGWSLLLATTGAMLCVTLLFARKKSFSPATPVVTSIISAALDQPLCKKLALSIQTEIYKSSEVLGGVWMTWVMILVVIVNGYKGCLLSFMTMGDKPVWPLTLEQLVNDNLHCIITSEKIHNCNGDLVPYVKSKYLSPIMNGTAGVDYPLEYKMLSEKLKLDDEENDEMIISPMIAETSVMQKIYNCVKFAVIDTRPAYDSVSMLYLMKEMVVSEPVVLPKSRKVNLVFLPRNFFTEPFVKAVAALEATGILNALDKFMSKLITCARVNLRSRWIMQARREGNPRRLQRDRLRCLTEVSGYVRNHNKLRNQTPPKALTISQLLAAFNVCLASVGVVERTITVVYGLAM